VTGDLTVLLVEDDSDDIVLTRIALHDAGVEPLFVTRDGDEAVAYLAGGEGYADRTAHPLPGLILLDLKLPRRSGFEVLEWLRAQPGLRRIPVVVLTSSRESIDINRAYELGANSYMVKPVSNDALLGLARTLNMYWFVFAERPTPDVPEPSSGAA
jgi:CheY-like chemotaxis protein